MYFAYVLKNKNSGKYYHGHTDNLARRLFEHNEEKRHYAGVRGPWEIVYYEEFSTRSEAMEREKFFKGGSGREFLKNILNK
ncbi:MAG: endonuclease [Elusimicrobia bacterium HGW-Elusimicrobia-2]|nr:MAG: endonuclease [Elusimicrobia bacterium HGW-Elusimicrobia-2]